MLYSLSALLSAAIFSADQSGSEGSALILETLTEDFAVAAAVKIGESEKDRLIDTVLTDNCFASRFSPVRPIPDRDSWFETVWNDFNKKTNRKQVGL